MKNIFSNKVFLDKALFFTSQMRLRWTGSLQSSEKKQRSYFSPVMFQSLRTSARTDSSQHSRAPTFQVTKGKTRLWEDCKSKKMSILQSGPDRKWTKDFLLRIQRGKTACRAEHGGLADAQVSRKQEDWALTSWQQLQVDLYILLCFSHNSKICFS